jgi:hypothetical protein
LNEVTREINHEQLFGTEIPTENLTVNCLYKNLCVFKNLLGELSDQFYNRHYSFMEKNQIQTRRTTTFIKRFFNFSSPFEIVEMFNPTTYEHVLPDILNLSLRMHADSEGSSRASAPEVIRSLKTFNEKLVFTLNMHSCETGSRRHSIATGNKITFAEQ